MRNVFMTGITGLVGGAVAARLLRRDSSLRIHALVRSTSAWQRVAQQLGGDAARVTPVRGDVTVAGLALDTRARLALRDRVSAVIHCAADTSFSQSLRIARAVNVRGTAHVVELATEWPLERFVHVSTAFVAGARTGIVAERELDDVAGFVNAYEQSKHEAEAIVRASALPWLVMRPSTIVCDDARGTITQLNAVHRALRVLHGGLAAMMPGSEDAPVDLVTTSYVAGGVAEIGLRTGAIGGTYHLCAGAGALPLGDLLARAWRVWSRDEWVRRGIVRPVLTDLDTYRLFEQSVEETGDARLAAITRSLSHFAPQLALPKRFLTEEADATLGWRAVPVRHFWDAVVEQLVQTRWCGTQRRAA